MNHFASPSERSTRRAVGFRDSRQEDEQAIFQRPEMRLACLTAPPAQSSLLTSVKYIFPSLSLQAPVLSVVITHGIYLIPETMEKKIVFFCWRNRTESQAHSEKFRLCVSFIVPPFIQPALTG